MANSPMLRRSRALSILRGAKMGTIRLSNMVPIITALVSVAGFLWGVYEFTSEQAKNRDAETAQQKREADLAERELMKPWLESQRQIYSQSLSAAAIVANSADSEKVKTATEEFFELYQGQMILVETKDVSAAMVGFGKCLNGSDQCSRADMNTRCRALGTAMATSMARTAKMTYQEFASNQFRYEPSPQ